MTLRIVSFKLIRASERDGSCHATQQYVINQPIAIMHRALQSVGKWCALLTYWAFCVGLFLSSSDKEELLRYEEGCVVQLLKKLEEDMSSTRDRRLEILLDRSYHLFYD